MRPAGSIGSLGSIPRAEAASGSRRSSIQRDVLGRGIGGDVLRALLPGLCLRRSDWTACPCPNTGGHLRGDATPSASVSAAAGFLVCHGCGVRADLVDLAVLVGRAPDRGTAATWLRATFLDRAPVAAPVAARVGGDDDADRIGRARALYARARRGIARWSDLRADDDRARLLREYAPPWPAGALDVLEVGFLGADEAHEWPPRLVFPVRDLDGAIVAVKLRAAVAGAGRKSISVGLASRGLIGREQLAPNVAAPAVLVGGEKDATHGVALLPSLAWCSSAIGEGGALGGLVAAFAGRDVLVLLDADAAGAKGAAERAAELRPVAASVRVVMWPEPVRAAGAKDVADVVARFGPERAARGLARLLGVPQPAEVHP